MITLPCGHTVADAEQVHYCDYLHLGALLALQPGADEVRHPDEHLFVVTHQVFELWFSQLRFDLPRVIEALEQDDPALATWLIQRCGRIVALFGPSMRLLETMTPSDFFAFRAHLAPASGTESSQWHEIELLAGLREPSFRRLLDSAPTSDASTGGAPARLWTERLERLWEAPSVASALDALLARRGVTPEEIYRVAPEANPNGDLVLLAEAMLDFDENFRLWRFAHARTAARTIGPGTPGTGHTTGVRYLDHAAVNRASFFPRLWEARSKLWERVDAAGPRQDSQ